MNGGPPRDARLGHLPSEIASSRLTLRPRVNARGRPAQGDVAPRSDRMGWRLQHSPSSGALVGFLLGA